MEKANSLSPVIGRDLEIDTVIQVLCRKQKNNPALVGDPGVGKTAIVEGLAQRIALGQVPAPLRNKRLMSVDMASMIAGTKYRGEFEERIRDVVAESRRMGNVILFFDEMHTLVGAGSAEGAIDASNLLKPALSRGEIQVIGATTPEEYRKFIEKDGALERRFRQVKVPEPSQKETLEILRGLRFGLEQHHHITITDGAMAAAVSLATRYFPEKFHPDKAVDLLDETTARVKIGSVKNIELSHRQLSKALDSAIRENRTEEAEKLRQQLEYAQPRFGFLAKPRKVLPQDVAETVAQRTGVPVGQIGDVEKWRLRHLESQLKESVMGQDKAISAVAKAVRRGRSGIADSSRPIATLLFMGPSGVGKTELCKALAMAVYGKKESFIRLDMSEYMEKHAVSRLIGAPPGYVGHGEGGELTEKVRRNPYAIVMLDEVEKAHKDVCNLLLQIMEDGILTDATGKVIDFKNTILIMTSNLGNAEQRKGGLGFLPEERDNRVRTALKAHFSPEFLGRVDTVAVFRPLEQVTLSEIAKKMLAQTKARANAQGLQLEVAQEVCPHLGQGHQDKDSGARALRNAIRELVEDPVAELLLTETSPTKATVAVEDNQIIVKV